MEFPFWRTSRGGQVQPDTQIKHGAVVCFYFSNLYVPEGCCCPFGCLCDPLGFIRRYIEGGDIEHVQIALREPENEKTPDEVFYRSYSVAMDVGRVFETPFKEFSNWNMSMYVGIDTSGEQLWNMRMAAQNALSKPFSYSRFFELYFCPSWGTSGSGYICIRLVMEILHAGGFYETLGLHTTTITTLYSVMREELTDGWIEDFGHIQFPSSAHVLPNPMMDTHAEDLAEQIANDPEPRQRRSLVSRVANAFSSRRRKTSRSDEDAALPEGPPVQASLSSNAGPSRTPLLGSRTSIRRPRR